MELCILVATLLKLIVIGVTSSVVIISKPYQSLLNYFGVTTSVFLNCALCTGFWVGIASTLILGTNPMYAGLTALASELTYRKLSEL